MSPPPGACCLPFTSLLLLLFCLCPSTVIFTPWPRLSPAPFSQTTWWRLTRARLFFMYHHPTRSTTSVYVRSFLKPSFLITWQTEQGKQWRSLYRERLFCVRRSSVHCTVLTIFYLGERAGNNAFLFVQKKNDAALRVPLLPTIEEEAEITAGGAPLLCPVGPMGTFLSGSGSEPFTGLQALKEGEDAVFSFLRGNNTLLLTVSSKEQYTHFSLQCVARRFADEGGGFRLSRLLLVAASSIMPLGFSSFLLIFCSKLRRCLPPLKIVLERLCCCGRPLSCTSIFRPSCRMFCGICI